MGVLCLKLLLQLAVNFSIFFTVGKLPNEWKFAQVTFIPKSTKLSGSAYYCPVSLLSSVEQAVETYLLWNIRTRAGL